ncbi:hypothetical protein [Christiangramia sp. OXR-203]|uniref:hypothetical protein n=1 Tax=Christiangramia sp. OXR-203 TaxID=3100176 RepID=UPI002AC8FE43|nr:hypothetical protein [Christiangramia sp. OXR-203]WPY97641.1 hypothetical protein T8I65_10690 [Christiangramia sp. OXR-203]
MNKNVLIVIILIFNYSYSQETVTKEVFEKSEINILSTEIIDTSIANSRAALQFKFIDYSDNEIKFYEAELAKDEFVSVTNYKYFFGAIGSISIMTVPFKIRSKNEQGYITAKADVKNIGVYLPLALKESKRYWLDNSTSTHKFSIGFLIAPMAQELNDKNTSDYFQNSESSYSAFMLSTSVAITYTYNNLTFALIPVGFDFGLDDAGKEWDNHANYWTGFGIGVDTKLFGF